MCNNILNLNSKHCKLFKSFEDVTFSNNPVTIYEEIKRDSMFEYQRWYDGREATIFKIFYVKWATFLSKI